MKKIVSAVVLIATTGLAGCQTASYECGKTRFNGAKIVNSCDCSGPQCSGIADSGRGQEGGGRGTVTRDAGNTKP